MRNQSNKASVLRLLFVLSAIVLTFFMTFFVVQASGTIQFSSHSPAKDSTISTFSPKISVYVKDSTYNLSSSSLKVTINGNQVPASLKYTVGHYEYDSCGGSYWVVDSYKEGIVSYQASNLPFGTHTVRVEITNSAGVTGVETWSFTVAGDIVFKYMTPTTAVGIRRPVISAWAYAPNGSFTTDDVKMTVGGITVTPTLTYQTNYYLISYQPVTDLADGQYPVTLDVYNKGKKVNDSVNWSFAVSANMTASNHTPAKDSTLNISNPKVSVYVKAGANHLDAASVTATFNGVSVTPSFQYKGHWEYDSCGGAYYVIDSYSEGTISFNTSALADGTYPVTVSIKNSLGTQLVEKWSFVVSTEVKFSSQSPANGSVTTSSQPKISVRAADGTKDANNILMFINGEAVVPTVTPLFGTTWEISYTPSTKLPDGPKAIQVDVFDTEEGVYKTTAWGFSVDAAPDATGFYPGKNTTVATSTLTVAMKVRDSSSSLSSGSASAKINGKTVPVRFEYNTYSDSCGVYTDPTNGTVYVDVAGLTDGVHTAEINVSDNNGNILTESWNFTVMEAPKFSGMTPTDGSQSKGVGEVSVKVTDTGTINWDSVRMLINGSQVGHEINQETGTITYVNSFVTGNYNVYVEVKDVNGNLGYKTWSILVDNTPPYLRYFYYVLEGQPPYNTYKVMNGIEITNGKLAFQGELKDSHVRLNNNATARLIGTETLSGKVVDQLLDITFRYHGKNDSCTGEYVVTDAKIAYITYSGFIRDGTYELTFSAEDYLGNKLTQKFNFTVVTPPVINGLTPLKYGVREAAPVISATVKDINGTIVPESIAMQVDGTAVGHLYDAAAHKVTYTPAQVLADESYHTVTLTATDDQGLITTKTWKFYTNVKGHPDMADSSMDNCTICHSYTPRTWSNGPFEDIHNGLSFGGGHSSNDCDDCHNYVTVGAGCEQCHPTDIYDENAEMFPHGSTTNISYWLMNYDGYFPVRVKQNREMWDCVICHQPGSQVLGYVGAYSKPSRLLNNHDIPDLHRTNAENCADCHAMSLTREHARTDRLDTNGQPINCATCHKSGREDVRLAISNNDTECGACHDASTTGTSHSDLHIVSYGTECVNCHGNNMMSEKVYHQNDCGGCHDSLKPKVQSAITLQNRTCFGCHETPHDVKMSVIREDVPLYSEVTWSKPDAATVWSGEGWLPAELNNDMALVLFSKAASLNRDTVYSFYKTALASYGWVQVTETLEESGAFRLFYRKGRRHILIWFYSGMTPNSGGGTGYRILTVYN